MTKLSSMILLKNDIKYNKEMDIWISRDGQVLSCKQPGRGWTNGYIDVKKYRNFKNKKVHRLIAEAYIENTDNKPYINHIDGNKSNNTVSNLEWCTAQENTDHAYATGLANGESAKKRIYDSKTNITYKSVKECAKANGINPRSIWMHKTDKIKHKRYFYVS